MAIVLMVLQLSVPALGHEHPSDTHADGHHHDDHLGYRTFHVHLGFFEHESSHEDAPADDDDDQAAHGVAYLPCGYFQATGTSTPDFGTDCAMSHDVFSPTHWEAAIPAAPPNSAANARPPTAIGLPIPLYLLTLTIRC